MSKKRIATSVDHSEIVVIDSGEFSFPTDVGKIPNDITFPNHYAAIAKAIDENRGDELHRLLSVPMQCSPVEYWEAAKIDMNQPENPRTFAERESGEPEGNTTYYLQVCPTIEGIAFLYPGYFSDLIAKLIKANNPALCTAFNSSMVETKGVMLPDNLYAWNAEIIKTLKGGISDIGLHGMKLQKGKDTTSKDKGSALVELGVQLSQQLEDFIKTADPNLGNDIYKLQILQFKLAFNHTLHSKDDKLGQHRGYAKIVSNIFSILFTGGLLNIINYARTGRFWLYSTTRSQDEVAALNRVTAIEQTPLLPLKVR